MDKIVLIACIRKPLAVVNGRRRDEMRNENLQNFRLTWIVSFQARAITSG